MKSKFTLIELITTIVILGILAAIVVVNVSDMKKDAIRAEVVSNTRNFQTAVDAYSLKNNGAYPTEVTPTLGNPQRIKQEILYSKYVLDDKVEHGYYWVDYEGQVWGSTVDAPQEVIYGEKSVSFNSVEEATAYEILGYGEGSSVTGAAKKNKLLGFIEKLIPTQKSKVVSYSVSEEDKAEMYLVSAYDRFDLPTPPVGNGYDGYESILPKSEDFSLVTNAGGKAVWEGLYTVETKPSGTSIEYTFQTSNDGKTYSSPVTDIKTATQSQYMKVNVKMNGANGQMPTVHKLHVKFRLVGEGYIEVDLVNNQTKSSNTVISSGDLILSNNQNSGSAEHVVQLPAESYVGDIIVIADVPYSGIIQHEYSSSPDGVNWSAPVFHPEELPEGKYVKIVTELERSQDGYSPIVDRIIIIPSEENPNYTSGPAVVPAPAPSQGSDWQTISSLEIIEDATQVGDWISVEVVEEKPANTQIVYRYSTSNDGSSWSGPYTTVDSAPNSRYFKVNVDYQKKPEATSNPKLKQITINYKLQDGTTKKVVRDVQADGSTIIVNPGTVTQPGTGTQPDPSAGTAVLVPLDDTLTCTADLQGSGTPTDPYLIHNANELNAMRTCLTASYKLMNDIDMSTYGQTYKNGKGWTPIGGGSTRFEGDLDGNNHYLTNLYVRSGPYTQGFFGDMANGSVKNLTIKNGNSSASIYSGLLAGRMYTSTIENVSVEGTVAIEQNWSGLLWGEGYDNVVTNVRATGVMKNIPSQYAGKNIGGLIGEESSSELYNVTADVDIQFNTTGGQYYTQVGGLIGFLDLQSNLVKGSATGSININNTSTSYTTNFVGGLVGLSDISKISRSYSTVHMNLTKANMVAGIVGHLDSSTISDSYAQVYVEGTNITNAAGGIGRVTDYTSKVTNIYSASTFVIPGNVTAGALVASNGTGFSSYITNSYYDSTLLNGYSAGNQGGIAKTTAELQTPSTFTGWSTGYWNLVSGKYPALK